MKVIFYIKITLVTFLLISGVSQAAVVMNASRIVMEGIGEKTVTFDNTSENPYIVQIESDNNQKPDFVAMPPIFKIKEKGGQTVKIKLSSSSLPQDKESVFYMNFTQIPGVRKNQDDSNRLNIVIRSRLKIIYRPKSVNAFSEKEESKVSYIVQSGKLIVSNNSPNVLSIREISNGKQVLAKTITLLPGGNYSTLIKDRLSGPLRAVIINDYGMPLNIMIADK
ncbi:fimbrial biogenesis chaperone [Pantoea agglomerans]|uniref:fimbrial biogenesis chaperone n=1 Tax=Enterobacter agglomerans TaxID=549 RepID=UPI00117E9442|nr:molecular chaperone [Pantoea agglomerans]NKE96672.1 molecular chaperone [Pantoea agglomerans]TRO68131.1 molecular chaperone [Pantoea agglomerans]